MARPVRRGRPSVAARRMHLGPGAGLVLVACAVRVLYVWLAAGPSATPSSDAVSYDQVAWNLARGAGFSLGEGAGAYATGFVPPVVPWLTSLLYQAVGHRFFAALLLQAAIGALAPLLTLALGTTLFGSSVGWIAAWLAALSPLLVFFSGYLLTETTFTVVSLAALALTASWVKTPRPSRAFGTGLLWGFAALTRPTALPLPILLMLWAWVPLGLAVERRERRRQVLLLVAGVALAVAPWTLRNAAVFRTFVPVTVTSGLAFLDGNNAVVWNDPARRGGALAVRHLEPYAAEIDAPIPPGRHPELEVSRRAQRIAWRWLAERPSEWPAMAAAKIGRMWRFRAETGSTGAWLAPGSPLAPLARWLDPLLVWFALTVPLAAWGVFIMLRGPRRLFQSMPLIPIGVATVGAAVYWGALRMRVPVEPLVLLFTAAGIDDLRRRARARARGLRLVRSPARDANAA